MKCYSFLSCLLSPLICLLVQVDPQLFPGDTFHISHTAAMELLYQNH